MSNQNENMTLSYGGHFESDGGAISLTCPFQADCIQLFNYTAYGTAADNVEITWFRGFPAGDALIKHVIADDGSTGNTNLQLETTNGITDASTSAGVDDSYFAISGATQADPVVLTTAAHGITVGEQVRVRISKVAGMTELNDLSRNPLLATALSSTTVSLQNLDGTDLDGSGFSAYSSGGQMNILTHLTGASKGPVQYDAPVYSYTLGTGVTNDDSDEIYFIMWKFGQYIDLGDQA